MGGVVDFAKDTFNAITGRGAEKAAGKAADTQSEAQREALEYLKEREAIPRQYSEGALGILGGLYGLGGGGAQAGGVPPKPTYTPSGASGFMSGAIEKLNRQLYDQEVAEWESKYGSGSGRTSGGMSQSQAMQAIQSNPIYQATIGQLPQQEEAILRNASATGALRTGGTEAMLAENQRMNQLSALQNTMSGLQGLAGLPSYAPQIAQGMAGIGQTQAQGMIAGAQARQQGIGQTLGLGLNALSLAGFSDVRLKDNVKLIGERYGHDWYEWEWNERAQSELGLTGKTEGVMAQDVAKVMPEAVGASHGYLTVNYEMLESAHG